MLNPVLRRELKEFSRHIKQEYSQKPVYTVLKYGSLPILMSGIMVISGATIACRIIVRVPYKKYFQSILKKA